LNFTQPDRQARAAERGTPARCRWRHPQGGCGAGPAARDVRIARSAAVHRVGDGPGQSEGRDRNRGPL